VSKALAEKTWPQSTVIYNPYRKGQFTIIDTQPRNRDFVFVGRLVSDKGADLAIEAISRLRNAQLSTGSTTAPVSLTIIGNGPELDQLKALAVRYNVGDYVTFTGTLTGDELVSCINKHKYILVPSIWEEPFGLVVLEGIACGCIPIVSDGGGLPEAVGNAGVTFKRGDLDSLMASINRIMSDNAVQEQCRQAGKLHLNGFEPENVSKKYMDVIDAVLNK
jgi:glycosyltransferase involved in cell wall biosynthesis